MKSDPLTPAVRHALRLWYRAEHGERRLLSWYEAGQTPPHIGDDSQVKWATECALARYRMSTDERVTFNSLMDILCNSHNRLLNNAVRVLDLRVSP